MKEKAADNDFKGLTEIEVLKSRQKYGANDIARKKRPSLLRQFLASFGDPIIKILLISLFVNLIFMFENFNWYETVGIAIAVLLATVVSTLSEYGSESAFEKLQEDAEKIKCRVKRAHGIVELPVSDIVVGDIVLIQAGERIPADGKLLSGELTVDQSALNGETKEAYKYPQNFAYENEESDFLTRNKLFRGSVVCSGEGLFLVTGVGGNTFYGKIAIEVQEETIESPLKARLTHLARIISRFGYAAAFTVIAANLFNNILLANHFDPVHIVFYFANRHQFFQDLIKAITLGITVLVMAVPEGLPMMITVILSSNMRRMLRDHVLVRKLVGIETAGSLNILFTDKTGTLTKGKLEVTAFIDAAGKEYKDFKALKNHQGLYDLIKLSCFYNNGAQVASKGKKHFVTGGNSTDRALMEFILDDRKNMPLYRKGLHIPFNSSDKMSATEIKGPDRLFLLKGAPENLLPFCAYAYDLNAKKSAIRNVAMLANHLSRFSKESVRILALCVCEEFTSPKQLKNLTLIGFLGIRDELRKEAAAAVKDVTRAGVQVVMITGDNKDTAAAVACKAGLIVPHDEQAVLTSAELNKMSDYELKKRLPQIRVVARALPSDKSRLVRISQELKLVAGMTGDGVNDAPALKKADVGFAMGDGTEVAKESSDIVILDNNFLSISKAILYGRTIFKSIRKFIIFQLTVNLCAVCVSIVGPFIGVESPVTVIQMLWINIIMDSLAGLAFAGEPPLPEYMRESPKNRNEKIINRYMYSQILFTGLYTTFLCLLFLKLPAVKSFFAVSESHFLTAFFTLFIFCGIFNSFSARTYRLNLFAYILKNRAFILIMTMVCVIQFILIYHGGRLFRTTGLPLRELVLVLLLATSVVFVDWFRKLILRAFYKKGTL